MTKPWTPIVHAIDIWETVLCHRWDNLGIIREAIDGKTIPLLELLKLDDVLEADKLWVVRMWTKKFWAVDGAPVANRRDILPPVLAAMIVARFGNIYTRMVAKATKACGIGTKITFGEEDADPQYVMISRTYGAPILTDLITLVKAWEEGIV